MRAESAWGKVILACVLCLGPRGLSQSLYYSADADSVLATLRTLYATGQWEAVARLASTMPKAPAEVDYYRGMAFARLQRWQEARAAFESGKAKAPHDSRFPLELAGVMFKEGKRREAESFLIQALRVNPSDAYGNDFLAGLYFLDGNLQAALKFWNRIRKPKIREFTTEPGLRVDPVLLDRAWEFSPDALLTLKEYYSSLTKLDALGIFPSASFDLSSRDDGNFDLGFRALERNGWGASWVDGLVSLLRGVPFQTLHPEFFNLRGAAWNSISLVRWDDQKRRFFTSISGPLAGNPGLVLGARLDLRRESWNVEASLRNAAPGQDLFTMSSLEAGVEVRTILGSRTSMRNELIISDRRFERNPVGSAAWQSLFRNGAGLGYEMELSQRWSAPEHRFDLAWNTGTRFGKILLSPGGPFVKFAGTMFLSWLPQAEGKDYQLSGRLAAGTTAGSVPFDELFSLGMERDNDLYARGHSGTRNGRKGAGPLGRGYLLLSCQMDKLIHHSGFWELSLGPFLDTGKTFDHAAFFGSPWIWDAGVQSKLTILGRFSLSLSYGRDLRGGKGALYTRILR